MASSGEWTDTARANSEKSSAKAEALRLIPDGSVYYNSTAQKQVTVNTASKSTIVSVMLCQGKGGDMEGKTGYVFTDIKGNIVFSYVSGIGDGGQSVYFHVSSGLSDYEEKPVTSTTP